MILRNLRFFCVIWQLRPAARHGPGPLGLPKAPIRHFVSQQSANQSIQSNLNLVVADRRVSALLAFSSWYSATLSLMRMVGLKPGDVYWAGGFPILVRSTPLLGGVSGITEKQKKRQGIHAKHNESGSSSFSFCVQASNPD